MGDITGSNESSYQIEKDGMRGWPRDFDVRASRAEQQELLEEKPQSPAPLADYEVGKNHKNQSAAG